MVDETVIRLSTTTSATDTGLLEELQEVFEAAYAANSAVPSYTLDITSVGSGAALNLARQGEADITLTHARLSEFVFMGQNYACERKHVFWNEFVLVGPASGGPVAIPSGSTTLSLKSGFVQIATDASSTTPTSLFFSRGEKNASGTWVREQEIWSAIKGSVPSDTPVPPGNICETDSSMLVTLQKTLDYLNDKTPTSGLYPYTLSDIGTWYKFQASLDDDDVGKLAMLTELDDDWGTNQYSLMPVNPYACFLLPGVEPDDINTAGALAFLNWMTGDTSVVTTSAESLINCFYIPEDDTDQQAFFYNANDDEKLPGYECILLKQEYRRQKLETASRATRRDL